MRIERNLIILCLVCLLVPAVAQSQEQNNWDFELAPLYPWAININGDTGGFGVSSDFTWQGLALIDFQPWRNVAIVAGYRAIYSDYSNDGFTYDATVHGPVVGIDIRW